MIRSRCQPWTWALSPLDLADGKRQRQKERMIEQQQQKKSLNKSHPEPEMLNMKHTV